jgi:hypothetical protein
MTSVYFRLSPYLLLEYQYGIEHLNTSTTKFRKIINGHNGFNTIVNDNDSTKMTSNVVDNTVVEIEQDKYALLDRDSAFFYPNIDPKVSLEDIITPVNYDVKYDRVRVHILSGYNFDNNNGFMVGIYMRTLTDKVLRLSNFAFDKGRKDLLFFNPKPIKVEQFIFDKYVEYSVPSVDYIISQQVSYPTDENTLGYLFTDGDRVSTMKNVYCEYNDILRTEQTNGIIYYHGGEGKKISFNTTDEFDSLTADIVEKENGYFEYSAKYNGVEIEDFMFSLNSLAGNNYYIIHDIFVVEQLGESFNEVDNFSIIQKDNYDSVRKLRPIIKNADRAVSISIDYQIRLFNAVDGRSILKRASLTSMNTHLYGEIPMRLNVGGTTQPLKVYNKKYNNVIDIKDNLVNLIKTKISSVYIDSNNIILNSNNQETYEIEITPFDNFFKFNLTQKDADGNISALELDGISTYFITFIKNDNTKNLVQEFVSDEFNKQDGQLAFKIIKTQSMEIRKYTNKFFYVISRNPDGMETVLLKGIFKL